MPLAILLIIIASPLMLIYMLHIVALRMAKALTDDTNVIPTGTKG
jgi:hypothetical protein